MLETDNRLVRQWHFGDIEAARFNVRFRPDCVAKRFCTPKSATLIQDQAAARNIDSKKCSVSIRLLSDRYSSSSFATQSTPFRTSAPKLLMSPNDPKRTFVGRLPSLSGKPLAGQPRTYGWPLQRKAARTGHGVRLRSTARRSDRRTPPSTKWWAAPFPNRRIKDRRSPRASLAGSAPSLSDRPLPDLRAVRARRSLVKSLQAAESILGGCRSRNQRYLHPRSFGAGVAVCEVDQDCKLAIKLDLKLPTLWHKPDLFDEFTDAFVG
jgi:hypothetical protein